MPDKPQGEVVIESLFRDRRRDRVAGWAMGGVGAAILGLVGWKMAPAAPFLVDNPGVIGGGSALYGAGALALDRIRRMNDDVFKNELEPMPKSVRIRGGAAILSGLIIMGITDNKGHFAPETSSSDGKGKDKVIAKPNIEPGPAASIVPSAKDKKVDNTNRIITPGGRSLVWYLPAEARSYGDCVDIKDKSVEPGQNVIGIALGQLGSRGYTPEEVEQLKAKSRVFTNEPNVSLDDIRPDDQITIYCPPPNKL